MGKVLNKINILFVLNKMKGVLFLIFFFINSSAQIKVDDTSVELNDKLDELFAYYKKKLHEENNNMGFIQKFQSNAEALLMKGLNTTASSSLIQTKQSSNLNAQPFVWTELKLSNVGPTSRRGHSTVVADTFMIVFGGCYMESPCYNDLFFLDFQSQKWISFDAKGRVPSTRQGHSAVLYGTTMWIYGGSSDEGYLNDLYSLNLETREWTKHEFVGPNQVGRTGHSAIIDNRSRIVIFGGYSERGYVNDILVVNILEQRFETPLTTGTPPSARENFSMHLINNRIYIFGGFHEGGVLNDLFSLDLVTWTWIKVTTNGPTPPARQGMASVRVGKKIFMTGGCDNQLIKCFTDTYIFDSDSLWWTQLENSSKQISARGYLQLIYYRSNIIGFGGCEMYKQCFSDVISMNVDDFCPNGCSSKGKCKELIGCQCDVSFTTHDCSQEVKCKEDCNKNGMCHSNAKCGCFPGWSGVLCGTLIPCPSNCTDFSHGVCQLNGSCKCKDGFNGTDCSQRTSPDFNPLKDLTAFQANKINTEMKKLMKESNSRKNPTTQLNCQNNCTGHGNCDNKGICRCEVNYTLADCSLYKGTARNETNEVQILEQKYNVSYIIGPKLELYYLTDDCVEDCSGIGVCLNSTCFCTQGYTKNDCSMTYKAYLTQGYTIKEILMYLIITSAVGLVITLGILIFTRTKNRSSPLLIN